MIRNVLLAGLLALSAEGCSDGDHDHRAATTGVDIEIKLDGAPAGWARVIGTIGSTNFLYDSLQAGPDGSYRIKADSAMKGGMYFFVLPNDVNFQMLIDKDQVFTLSASVADPINSARIEGSLDNELLYQNLRFEADFQPRIQPLNQQIASLPNGDPQYAEIQQQIDRLVGERKAHLKQFNDKYPNSFFTIFKHAGQNPDLRDLRRADGRYDEDARVFHYRKDFWENTPLEDERLLRTPIIFNKLKNFLTLLVPQVRDSLIWYSDFIIQKSLVNKDVFKFVVNWIAIEYREPKQMGMEAVFVHVIDKWFTDSLAFWSTAGELKDIRRVANEIRPSLIGNTGQDLRCINTKGKYESLYDLKGPATVLYIWNYECEHCQERTPVLKEVFERYRGKGLEVYSLCTGTDEKRWRDFIAKYGIERFHNVWDPRYESDFYKKYHIDHTPEVYVLDRQHKIVAKDLHPNQLPVSLDALF